jgi:hypothetical protein
MISHYPLLETAPFMEFTSVKVTDAFNHLFDIEKKEKPFVRFHLTFG